MRRYAKNAEARGGATRWPEPANLGGLWRAFVAFAGEGPTELRSGFAGLSVRLNPFTRKRSAAGSHA